MGTRIKCPDCGEFHEWSNEMLGRRVKCGICNFEFVAEVSLGAAYSDKLKSLADNPGLMYAGFWKRLGATIVDIIVLGAIGAAICFPLFNTIAGLGYFGFIIGAVIAGLYFVLMLGEKGGGQTLGKRALGIRVVSEDGKVAEYKKLILRYLIYNVFFMNNILAILFLYFNSKAATLFIGYLGVIPFIMYILVFGLIVFHPQKRGLHDLFAGTYVINTLFEEKFVSPEFKEMEKERDVSAKTHKSLIKLSILAVSLILIITTFGIFISRTLEKSFGTSLETMLDARVVMQKETGLFIPSINLNQSSTFNQSSVRRTLIVTIASNNRFSELSSEVEMIDNIRSRYPELRNMPLVVNLYHEAGIGIFKLSSNENIIIQPSKSMESF